ncbi:3'(2'),5'-bisphosphate nucleotidase CysQ [Sphingomonas montana]|uniref:3'(2'),5'-bisphosphate nucleotidase CysQ n=1 Tax=Sphingomonas montana TaxID=1843236 RepID=UPI0019CF8D4E|nr:3'(2'),5'-bisphosphate nucleotidase CysQ [Sphingomonas montana]
MTDATTPGTIAEQLSDAALARRVAETAGEILMTLRGSDLFRGKALGAAGDAVANAFIVAALREARPDDAILSEEEAADPTRLANTRAWIVDPLDGTREYGDGRADWAVHIALAVDGRATAGAVALPAQSHTICTAGCTAPDQAGGRIRMVVSRSRPAAEALQVAKALDAELIPMGSAGAKAMAVVRGEADIYLHSGGQYEWDSCAPVAVAQAAGLHVSRIDGSPLVYNMADPWLPDLLICRADLAEPVFAVLRGAA